LYWEIRNRPEELTGLPRYDGHYWFLDTYANTYQHGHWVEGTAFMAAALRRYYEQIRPHGTDLGPVRAIFLPKIRPNLTEIADTFLKAATSHYDIADHQLYDFFLGFGWLRGVEERLIG